MKDIWLVKSIINAWLNAKFAAFIVESALKLSVQFEMRATYLKKMQRIRQILYPQTLSQLFNL